MAKLDITNNTAAVDALLEKEDDPLHRRILENWRRHSLLEVSGNWPDIFTPEMTVADPEYKMYLGGSLHHLRGRAQIEPFYAAMTEAGHNVIAITDQHIVVNDGGFAQNATFTQYFRGWELNRDGQFALDDNAWYIRRAFLVEFWPYNDEGILLGEYVAEMGPPEIIPIDESEVITFQEARDALTPLLRPLSAYAG